MEGLREPGKIGFRRDLLGYQADAADTAGQQPEPV
jgi:hypothetical protein